MKLRDLLPTLESLAPLHLAESWDNVGLLAGDRERRINKALLAIDFTPQVAAETLAGDFQLVIAYHPPIFQPLKRIVAPSPIFDALSHHIAIYSPHTALDAADGGTNDILADVLGLNPRQALRPITLSPWHYKLVTFIPQEKVESVCQAIFDAGAGWIGRYSHCSFRAPGTGTFLGHEGTNPTVGKTGHLEYTPEIRIETIVPSSKLSQVVAALLRTHPYEEPAYDIIQLTTPPVGKGMGRIGTLGGVERHRLFDQIKDKLGVKHLLIAGPTRGPVTKAACCAGAGGEFLTDAIQAGAEFYLTGEIRHHDALKAAAAGMTVVCALHSNTERLTLLDLAARLREKAPAIQFVVSMTDHDPFTVV